MRTWILSFVLALPLLAQGSNPSTVRALHVAGDHDGAIRAFTALAAPSLEERAFAVAAYAHTGRTKAAKRQLELLRTAAPDNIWTLFAEASHVNAGEDIPTKLAAGERMMARAGASPDEEIVRLEAVILSGAEKIDEALALLDKYPPTPRLRVTRASLYSGRGQDKETLEVYDALRKETPDYVEAWSGAGRYLLGRRRYDEAVPLLAPAAALTGLPRVHADYWRALMSSPTRTAEQKKAELERGIADLRARRGDTPEVWLAIATEYARNGNDAYAGWNDRVLREAPNTLYAGRALWNRYTILSKKQGAKIRESPELTAEARRIVREYLDYDTRDEDYYRVNAYSALYGIVRNDPNATEAEIIEVVEGIRPTFSWNAGMAADAASLLVEHNVRLDLAEEIARSGFDSLKTTLLPSELADGDLVTQVRATLHDGLGWVLLRRSGPDAARNHLFAAYELAPNSPTIQYHLGQWHEARNELAKAEQRYRYGATLQSSRENLNEPALRKLYEKRHGTLAGYEAYRKSSEKADIVSRRSRILAERKKNPVAAPPFKLQTLDGKEVSLAALKGKTAVVNFWGIWCGWCVKEMPEYQQLAKKYAKDPSVAILTVNNDGDPQSVRKWMAEQKYDFAVLLDDGFVTRNKVAGFPTTWFLDPKGRIAFEKKGWTKKLLEEFSWRVEELKAAR
jgi:thiol-disulfide isomerase/thioredoxin